MSQLRVDRQPTQLSATGSIDVEVGLSDQACVRAGVVVRPEGGGVAASLLSPTGALVAQARGRGAAILLGRDGPVCVDKAGTYRIGVAAEQGLTQIWLRVWSVQSPDAGSLPAASSK